MGYLKRIDKIRQQIGRLSQELSELETEIRSGKTDREGGPGTPGRDLDSANAVSCYLGLAPGIEEDDLLNMILRCAKHTVDAGGAGMTLFDPEKGKLVFRAAIGDGAENIVGYEVPLEGSLHGLAYATGEIQSSTPLHSDIEEKAKAAFRNVLVAPLTVNGDGVGTMSAVNKQHGNHFTPEDMASYQYFSDLAAIVVQQRIREKMLKTLMEGKEAKVPEEFSNLRFSAGNIQFMELLQDLMEISRNHENRLPLIRTMIHLLAADTNSRSGRPSRKPEDR